MFRIRSFRNHDCTKLDVISNTKLRNGNTVFLCHFIYFCNFQGFSVCNGGICFYCNTPTLADVKITFDPTLVRGMGYYTGTIFEISIDGYNFSIAGGGRYDKMIGKFCGQDVSACGFSIGFERIITILKDKLETVTPVSEKNLAILIGKNVSLDRKLEIFKRAKALRAEGTTVTIQPMRKNMKQQIEKLEAEGFKEFEKVYND